eukprot:NODE_227_length_13866_cov_0.400305.p4 type:complete len:401 gc:universal NODE_227_length_13866_cov_0.400305:4669-3467(-)
MPDFVSFFILEIILFLWITGWVIAIHINRYDATIAKRGYINMLMFSVVVFICCSENFIFTFFNYMYLMLPCSIHFYVNYMFYGVFMFTYIVRGICLIFEKHSGMIKTLNEKEYHQYIERMNWFEKIVIRSKTLERKLKSNSNKIQIIDTHLNQTKFFKPRIVLVSLISFMLIGAFSGTLLLCFYPLKFYEPLCLFEMYYLMYLFFILNTLASYFVAYLLRSSHDPYFMKYEFTIFLCIVTPIAYALGLALRYTGHQFWTVSIIIMLIIGHTLSVIIPILMIYKSRRNKSIRLTMPRNHSTVSLDFLELKKKAAQRFCIELVLFKQDYHSMKRLYIDTEIELSFDLLYKLYIAPNSPLEINVSAYLSEAVKQVYNTKDYSILEVVMEEVNDMLIDILGTDS